MKSTSLILCAMALCLASCQPLRESAKHYSGPPIRVDFTFPNGMKVGGEIHPVPLAPQLMGDGKSPVGAP